MIKTTFVTAFVVIILAGPSAFAQDQSATVQSSAQSAKPVNRPPKVWTDDNIDSVRTPADDYMIQQEEAKKDEQQAAAKQAAAKAAAKQGTYPVPVAKTPQQADQIIAKDKQELKQEQDYIKKTEEQLATAPDSYRARLQWRIKSRSAVVERLQTQIGDLEKQKDALAKKPAGENGSGSAGPGADSGSSQQ